MPLVWARNYRAEQGKSSRIVTTTMGAAADFENEGLRRLVVNACYWAVGLQEQLPAKANVDFVGAYQPTSFGFGKYKKGIRPAELELKR